MIFVGVDWAEGNHMVCVVDDEGTVLARRRVPDGLDGLRWVHEAVALQGAEPSDVAVGIETDHGLFVQALAAAGYQVYPINSFMMTRYRERQSNTGKKSDPGDAKVLADAVRTDRHNHRPITVNSNGLEALQVLTRSHQQLISDRVRHSNRLRNQLREYYPGALEAFKDLDAPEVLELLERAPIPERGRRLSLNQIAGALRRANRRKVPERAVAIQSALRKPRLEQPQTVADAYAVSVQSLVRVLSALNQQVAAMEAEITLRYEAHPEARIYDSFPGIGEILGPRILAEMGDAPNCYADSKSRKAYAGTAPVTRRSGQRVFIHRRVAVNGWLIDALFDAAEWSLQKSPGARFYYHLLFAKHGKTHNQAIRAIANHYVGCLHGCLRYRTPYDESVAWSRFSIRDEAA